MREGGHEGGREVMREGGRREVMREVMREGGQEGGHEVTRSHLGLGLQHGHQHAYIVVHVRDEFFLAQRAGAVVGRISVILQHQIFYEGGWRNPL